MNRFHFYEPQDGELRVVRTDSPHYAIHVSQWDGFGGEEGKWYVYHVLDDGDVCQMGFQGLNVNSDEDVIFYVDSLIVRQYACRVHNRLGRSC